MKYMKRMNRLCLVMLSTLRKSVYFIDYGKYFCLCFNEHLVDVIRKVFLFSPLGGVFIEF